MTVCECKGDEATSPNVLSDPRSASFLPVLYKLVAGVVCPDS